MKFRGFVRSWSWGATIGTGAAGLLTLAGVDANTGWMLGWGTANGVVLLASYLIKD